MPGLRKLLQMRVPKTINLHQNECRDLKKDEVKPYGI